MHLLGHAATTPSSPQAAQAMVEVMTSNFANPSPVRGRPGAQGSAGPGPAVIAGALGCRPEELFLPSCGTEGDNWAFRAAMQPEPAGWAATCHHRHRAQRGAPVREAAGTTEGCTATYLRPGPDWPDPASR